MTGNLDIAYMGQTLPRLLDALPITLLLFFTAALLLVLFAIGLTFVRIFETPVLFPLSAVMTSFIRGTPLLLQLLVIYYGLPLLLRPLGIDINGIGQFAYAALALVLHDGTYLSELLLPAYRAITTPTLVIGFADDVVLPPHLGREVADALPNGRYLEIADAGHLGFIEKPQAVNAAVLDFFADRLDR